MARREEHQSVECRGGRRSAGEVRRQRVRLLVLLRWRYWQVRQRARHSSGAGGGTLQHGLRGKGKSEMIGRRRRQEGRSADSWGTMERCLAVLLGTSDAPAAMPRLRWRWS